MTNCKSCGATIFWARTEAGKLIPIDAEQVYGGNIVLMDNGNTAMVVATDSATKRHVSHFATCMNSAAHRKVGGGRMSKNDYAKARQQPIRLGDMPMLICPKCGALNMSMPGCVTDRCRICAHALAETAAK